MNDLYLAEGNLIATSAETGYGKEEVLIKIAQVIELYKAGALHQTDLEYETEENIKNGSYVVQRPFVLVTMVDRELSDAAFKFFNYVTSGEANEIISAAGVVPAN